MAAPSTPQRSQPTSTTSSTMLVQPAPTVNQNPSVGFSAVTKKLWNMFCKIKVGTLTISTRPYRTAKSSISPLAPIRIATGRRINRPSTESATPARNAARTNRLK